MSLICINHVHYNDLHHAVDAYLNVVVGNVYHMRFSRQWFSASPGIALRRKHYLHITVKCQERLFGIKDEMLPRVLKTAKKNTAHFTKYANSRQVDYLTRTR